MNDAIDAYRPRLKQEHWALIADFVREAVRDCDTRTVYTARELLAAAARYVDWCYRIRGLPLERERIFNLQAIEQFADRDWPGLEPSTVGNYRTKLIGITKALNPTAIAPSRTPLPPSQGVAPYTEREEEDLWIWAHAQADPAHQRDAIILLAGGLGAGLNAREVCDLRGRDVVIDAQGVLVRVTEPRMREVPVLSHYEHLFVDMAQSTRPDAFVFRPRRKRSDKNTASSFVARSAPSRTVVSTQRTRATWVVRHLRRGVQIDALMEAMGVGDFSAIARYLQHVPELGRAQYRQVLRASGGEAS